MDIFEKGTKLKLRFASPVGNLSIEQLWDLPLQADKHSRADLDTIAIEVNRKLKASAEESFVKTITEADPILTLKLDILKKIIKVKQEEAEAAKLAAARAEKKQYILSLIAEKQNEELKGKSITELQKMVDDI